MTPAHRHMNRPPTVVARHLPFVICHSSFVILLFAGCLSVGGKTPPAPRYMVAPARAEATPLAETNRLAVIGRVRAAPHVAGSSIACLDAKSGRTTRLEGGVFAEPVETMVATALRNWLSRSGAFGSVADLSVAPRNRDRLLVEAWVERFDLVRDGTSWKAQIELHVFTQMTSASFREYNLSTSVAVEAQKDKKEKPSAPAAVRAFSKGLSDLLARLEKQMKADY